MDSIVRQIGMKNNCTFCGVFRRQALDRGAVLMKADKICTGQSALNSRLFFRTKSKSTICIPFSQQFMFVIAYESIYIFS